MSKAAKVWLIVAASLIVAGLIMFVAAMWALGWDFTRLSTGKYNTNTHALTEEFSSISINTDTADIVFELSDDGQCTVECYEEQKAKHSVSIEEGTLVIDLANEKDWYDYIGIHFHSPKITVYLPEAQYTSLFIKGSTCDINVPRPFSFENVNISTSTGDVDFSASASRLNKIKTNTGNVSIENTSAGALNISTSTGDITVSNVACESDITTNVTTGRITLTNITCGNLTSTGDTGDISLSNVIAAQKIYINRSTGDVKFDHSDGQEIFVETDTGNVSGSLLTEKFFITHTDTGDVDVPQTTNGGKCTIRTDTGDIKITIE